MAAGTCLLVWVCLQAMALNPKVSVLWDHDPGPYLYRVYSTTNLLQPISEWTVITNVTELSADFPFEAGGRFFAVTCVDTNTGLESDFAGK